MIKELKELSQQDKCANADIKIGFHIDDVNYKIVDKINEIIRNINANQDKYLTIKFAAEAIIDRVGVEGCIKEQAKLILKCIDELGG